MSDFIKSFILWLEPPLDRLEQEYRLYYLHPDIHQTTIVGIIFVVGDLGLALSDYALFSQTEAFFVLLLIRLALAVVTAGLIVMVNRIIEPKAYDRFVFFCALFVAVMAILIDTTRPINFLGRFMIYLVLVFSVYLVLPNTLFFRLGAALFITAACIVSMFALTDRTAEILAVIMIVCLLVTNWVGLVTSARYYTFRRKQYQALHEEHARNQELVVLAETDSLTGIPNRRKFFALGAYEFERSRRHQTPVCLAVLDLDFFKRVNQAYGHVIGDQVLVALVVTIKRELSGMDRLGRLGDDEFGILFPETAQGAALRSAERIRQRVYESNDLGRILDHSLTVSLGVCDLQTTDRNFEDWLRRAEKALNRAKGEEGNRTVAG